MKVVKLNEMSQNKRSLEFLEIKNKFSYKCKSHGQVKPKSMVLKTLQNYGKLS